MIMIISHAAMFDVRVSLSFEQPTFEKSERNNDLSTARSAFHLKHVGVCFVSSEPLKRRLLNWFLDLPMNCTNYNPPERIISCLLSSCYKANQRIVLNSTLSILSDITSATYLVKGACVYYSIVYIYIYIERERDMIMYIHICIYMLLMMCVHIYIYIYIYTYIYIYIYVAMSRGVCVYIYIYICIYTHTCKYV